MPLHDRPIGERIEALLALSREHADTFCSPSAWLARERYLAKHPTRILAMKCMDGRIHLPHATRTPLGIITPFRNLGASSIWAGPISARCSPMPCTRPFMAATVCC